MCLKNQNFVYNNLLKLINERLENSQILYQKSIFEFNPANNNYYYGYSQAIKDLKNDIIVYFSKGDVLKYV